MVSMLPAESVGRLRLRFGVKFERLSELEAQVLVTADVEGAVSNLRMQEMATTHPAELTKVLQGLVKRAMLTPLGVGRGTRYQIGEGEFPHKEGEFPHKGGESPHKTAGTPHIRTGDSTHNGRDSTHKEGSMPPDRRAGSRQAGDSPALASGEWVDLEQRAEPARASKRLNPAEMESLILAVCADHFLTVNDLALLLQRNADGLQDRFLKRLVREGRLVLRYPGKPNQPGQAYRTVTD